VGQREWFEGLITSPSQPTYVGQSEFYIQIQGESKRAEAINPSPSLTSRQMESSGLKQFSTLRHLGGMQLSLEQQLIRGCLRAHNFDGACRSR